MPQTPEVSETVSRLKKHIDNVFADNFRAERDVESLVVELLTALEKAKP